MDGDTASAVPIGEGESPFWSADGTRIFLLRRSGAGAALVWLPVKDGIVPAGAQPQVTFPCEGCFSAARVGTTGKFVVLRQVVGERPPAIINVVLNWTRELAGR